MKPTPSEGTKLPVLFVVSDGRGDTCRQVLEAYKKA